MCPTPRGCSGWGDEEVTWGGKAVGAPVQGGDIQGGGTPDPPQHPRPSLSIGEISSGRTPLNSHFGRGQCRTCIPPQTSQPDLAGGRGESFQPPPVPCWEEGGTELGKQAQPPLVCTWGRGCLWGTALATNLGGGLARGGLERVYVNIFYLIKAKTRRAPVCSRQLLCPHPSCPPLPLFIVSRTGTTFISPPKNCVFCCKMTVWDPPHPPGEILGGGHGDR